MLARGSQRRGDTPGKGDDMAGQWEQNHHPGRALVVLGERDEARALGAALVECLDLDVTAVRDTRIARTLLAARSKGRWRLVIAARDVHGGAGLKVLREARERAADTVTVLISSTAPVALDPDAPLYVDLHVTPGVTLTQLRAAVLRAMGVSPSAALRLRGTDRRMETLEAAPLEGVGFPFGVEEETWGDRAAG